ncbi:MAG: sigma-54-dependent Fis family transcriptional regulator [Candidatus Cloacimonetes bacterium]|nr:sigma-54-dependent Fis family transcriptional regulator [Candidatus Cloacimonadota bacterium]
MKYINEILIVDDEQMNIDAITLMLKNKEINITSANNGFQALDLIKQQNFDVIISDVRMPGMSGLELLKKVREISLKPEFIVITAYSKISDAVAAVKNGAFDYIEKPFSRDALEVTLEKVNREKALKAENILLKEKFHDKYKFENIIGKNQEIQNIFEIIKVISKTTATVLIQGKSGTGKEMIANAIHTHSNRANNNFVKLNCAALPENLVESELFGYEKGAFTGANKTHIGKFEYANHGTILLDEISELRFDLQAKLLRFLQEKEFTRVGGNTPIKVDVRVITTTNKDLEQLVAENKFREDLFYRLNVVKIQLPNLNDRKNDIPLLTYHFIDKYSKKYNKNIKNISLEGMKLLEKHNWNGNVRELENTIEQAVLFCDKEVISSRYLRLENYNFLSAQNNIFDSDITIAELEKRKILKTLKKYMGNKTKAAEILGITTRTLRNKLKTYSQQIQDED